MALKGSTLSESCKKHISESLKGRKSWNQGLTKETNASVAVTAEKNRYKSHGMKGRKHTEQTKRLMSEKKIGRNKYNDASMAAGAEKRRGRKHTEQTKKLISEKNKGNNKYNNPRIAAMADRRRGKNKYNDASVAAMADKKRGRTKYTDAGVAAMAEKLRGRTGEKSATWRGGLSFEPYSPIFNRELKKTIRERDDYKCQGCGVPQIECIKALPIHHIDYNKKNSTLNNLISLCISCNIKANTNRTYWEIYYKLKIIQNKKEQLKLVALDYSVLNS